jgi:hypothetical protein
MTPRSVISMFRTIPNSKIDPATDDLGPGSAVGIDIRFQFLGVGARGAFRTAPDSPVNAAADHLRTAGAFATTNVTALARRAALTIRSCTAGRAEFAVSQCAFR